MNKKVVQQAIHAPIKYTKTGNASKISVVREICYGLGLGIAFASVWKVCQRKQLL